MSVIVLDANAVIMHGRAFPERVHAAVETDAKLVLPRSVKQELVDDVLNAEDAPENHRAAAQAIQELIDEGYLVLRNPDYEAYSDVIDEARRRIANDSLPEHDVKADQYIPALVTELAQNEAVTLVTADRKLRETVREITKRQNVADQVTLSDPLTVL
ncbi:PIN domain-containing protein [Halococcus sp. PRR34]|uniref:PIN domain-containing protein n=1 Tax=Halococcus sp. PRR34 TaxID=3020830 RepID=UPI0023601473|nr:PIN domain-containing protein [Halococcus sp. PRR34]